MDFLSRSSFSFYRNKIWALIVYRIATDILDPVAARRLRLLPEASVIIGIPISAKGKSVYFDRPAQ